MREHYNSSKKQTLLRWLFGLVYFYDRTVKALAKLHEWAGSSDPSWSPM